MSRSIRDQISQILVRHTMSTRQVAISELVELVEAQVQAPSLPMGITAWIEHGEKYGYYTYATLQTQILADRRFEAAINAPVAKGVDPICARATRTQARKIYYARTGEEEEAK